MIRTLTFLFFLLILTPAANSPGVENVVAPEKSTTIVAPPPVKTDYPSVVIYTLSTCPHCREAKQYLTAHNIPFINREVDSDDDHMAELVKIYDSMGVPEQNRGVPLFVIGGKTNVKGFDKEKLEKALKELSLEPKK